VRRARQGIAAALTALLLGGCAGIDFEAGAQAVRALTAPQLGTLQMHRIESAAEREAAAQRSRALLARELDGAAAVELALLNHRGLQAALAELRIAAADVAQAAAPPNPVLGLARIKGGGEVEIERGLHWAIGRLLTLPQARRAALAHEEQQRLQTAAQVLATAAQARRAWVQAVAAEELRVQAERAMDAAAASAELARRMAQVGNFNRLQRVREQRFGAEAALDLARAESQAAAAREALVRALGLWGDQLALLKLPSRLPPLPGEPADRAELERIAIEQRLDLRAARAAAEAAEAALGSQRLAALAAGTSLGLEWAQAKMPGEAAERHRKIELGIELPVFDAGTARIARSQAVRDQAQHRLAELAVEARSEVRSAHAAWRHAWDIARHHRDELLPLQAAIAEENLLRYNGMLIGVFELLADARSQIVAVQRAIEATRDYWLAEIDLDAALVGKPLLAALSTTGMAAPAASAAH
jgi:outer membrane protein TolC